ncbi:hypothetical protein Pfo_013325 [Paulownia fortunei]|nr:hypothetical protein Pfo_013325 [Paulownia fortunei]
MRNNPLIRNLITYNFIFCYFMGRTCESVSANFRGLCFIDQNCRIVCSEEGFTDGDCQGLLRRCFCKKPC